MIGTLINGAAILLGGAAGMAIRKDLSAANQSRLKVALGCFTIYAGILISWRSMHDGFLQGVGQFLVVMAALVLGNLLGKLIGIQKQLNRLGQHAREQFTAVSAGQPIRASDGFLTCSIVFCLGPLAFFGSLLEGLSGDPTLLFIKAAMDAMAVAGFARVFGWATLLSALPLVAFQGTLTFAAQAVSPVLRDHALLDSVTLTAGLIVCGLSLLIFDAYKVRWADYLPALFLAPLLVCFF